MDFEDGLGAHALNREADSRQIEISREDLLPNHFDNFRSGASKPLCDGFVSKWKAALLVSILCLVVIVTIEILESFCGFYQRALLLHAALAVVLGIAAALRLRRRFDNLLRFLIRPVFFRRIAGFALALFVRRQASIADLGLPLG